jgi:hypothetical protein
LEEKVRENLEKKAATPWISPKETKIVFKISYFKLFKF